MKDYSEALIIIQELRKKAQDALLRHDWKTACDCADEVVVAARGMKMYALDKIESAQKSHTNRV